MAREVERGNAACQDGDFGLVSFSRLGADAAFDECFGVIVNELAACVEDSLAEGAVEVTRVKVAILREPDAAFGIDGGLGVEFLEAVWVDDFSFESETMRGFGDFSFFIKPLLGLAEHEEALVDERKFFFFGEFEMEFPAEEAEVAEESFAFCNMRAVRVAHEEPDPPSKRRIEARAEKEGALGIEHPFESLGDDSWGGERGEVTRDDHAGVAAGAGIFELWVTLDDADGVASF